MTAFSKRVWIAILLSSIIFGCLIFLSPLSLADAADLIQPEWGLAASGLFLLNLIIRGFRLANLSEADCHVPRTAWIHCAARNQFLFSALPSAAGDLGFPYIAKKLCGIGFVPAARMVARYRFQDMLALAGMLALGLALLNGNQILIVASLVAIPILLYWSESIVMCALRVLFQFVLRIPVVRDFRIIERVKEMVDSAASKEVSDDHVGSWLAVVWTIFSWSLAVTAFWCLFRMVGEDLTIGTILVIVAGLNFFGTINTLTVGGLGVSESALATILISLQYSYESAVSVALIVRPSALIMTLTACLFVELVACIGRWRKLAANHSKAQIGVGISDSSEHSAVVTR